MHHWQKMIEEVEYINNCKKEKRVEYLLERINDAIMNLESIPVEIISSQKGTDYFKLLKNLKGYLENISGGG